MMKIYSKLLGTIWNNKTRVKKAVGIVTGAVVLRYGRINSIPTNLLSNFTQQVEQVINTDSTVKDALSHKSSSHFIKTGSGILIGNQQISEGSKSTLITRSGALGNSNPGSRGKPDAIQNQNPGGASSSLETISRRLSPEYKDYQQKFNSPPLSQRFDTKNYDPERFKELAKDSKATIEVFHKTTVDEARTAIHAEIEGLVDNAQPIEQPICKSVDLDFKVNGPAPYTHMDVKHPVGSDILRKQNQTIDIKTIAYRMGNEIIDQKERFCRFEQGPESSENVLHLVDLAYVPSHEKEIVKKCCLKGAGSSEGIQFLNDK